jgi:hypothetical protein
MTNPNPGRNLQAGVYSMFGISNIFLYRDSTNYFAQSTELNPFTHTWSLGVEEQFYLLWPLFLLSLFRWRLLDYIAVPLLFVTSILTSHIYPTASFFSPTSRAWEFLIGAFVSTLPPNSSMKFARKLILISSWLIVLVSLVFVKPGFAKIPLFTLPIVLAIGTLIYFGFSSVWLKPIEFVGNISYSLYLIHWPIIAILLYHLENIGKFLAFGIFLLSLFLAKFVTENFENPIRNRQKYLKKKQFWVAILAPTLALYLLALSQGFSVTQRGRLFEINNAIPSIYSNGCHTNTFAPKETGCDFGALDSSKLIMLVGDSHAAQWFPGFEKASLRSGFRLRVATKSSCPAILPKVTIRNSNSDCIMWEKNVIKYINETKPELVVLSNLTESNVILSRLNSTSSSYVKSLANFISKINSESKVVVIGDTAYPDRDSISCLSFNWKDSTKCDLKNSKTEETSMTKLVANFRTIYFDSRPFFCKGEICPSVMNGKNVYRDGSHISLATVGIQEILAAKVFDSLK